MAQEIERKFLVHDNSWSKTQGRKLVQAYIASEEKSTVRIRIDGEQAFLTIKGRPQAGHFGRLECEYPIPVKDAQEMIDELACSNIIEKTRYKINFENMLWEVDQFQGDNEGLVLAEIELESEDQKFSKPKWAGLEVTHDFRFSNSSLARLNWQKFKEEFA